jgi:lysophospholipase L1-like esterase
VDTDSLIAQNPANLQTGADNLHPSMKGAGLIAQAIAQAVNSYYIAHPADLAQTGKGIS